MVCPDVGADFGISAIVALSDVSTIQASGFVKESNVRVRITKQYLSSRPLSSMNRGKTGIQPVEVWGKVRNRGLDFAHDISRHLAENYGTSVFEDLAIGNVVKNHRLVSPILDTFQAKTHRLTARKAEQRGGRVILVDPSGSSQECSGCGKVMRTSLAERVHSCPDCGLGLDSGIKATTNVLAGGLERASVETGPLHVVETRKLGGGSEKLTGCGSDCSRHTYLGLR